MDVLGEYKKLIESDLFKEFISLNKDFYLVHAYTMLGEKEKRGLEFGFYNENTDKIVVFETDPLNKREEEEAFKEGKSIELLELNKVNISLDEALDIAEKKRKEKYPSEIIYKSIVILQNIGVQVWNITLISMSFNIVNIKVDSETGEVVSSNMHSILNLGTKI